MSYGRRITHLAELDPERAAVTCGQSTLTRRQLEQRANRLARDFLERGVEVGDMVTIALPNSTDWYVAMAACSLGEGPPRPGEPAGQPSSEVGVSGVVAERMAAS